MNKLPVIIVGGGIGGLATASGLAQKGISSIVLEKSTRLGEIGAGIQLSPNAFHSFDFLGVGDAARAMALYVDNLILMDALTGKEITKIPLQGEFRRRFGNPYAVMHRSDLHDVLHNGCIDHELVEIRASSGVECYEQDSNTVTAILESGERVVGRALVGADGLWSSIRKQVVGDGDPRVSGHTTYRSVISDEQMPEELRWKAATLWAGPNCHIVHYPLKTGDAYNLVLTRDNDAPEPVAGVPVSREAVRKEFDHVTPTVQQLIDCGTDWKYWVLCDRAPVLNWVDGKVCLLGDAAHPMLQYFAQGACMAMEDAVCLSAEMERHAGDVEKAFVAYNERRVLRATRLQLQSRALGDYVYHPSGAEAALRNAVMSARTPDDWYDQIEWLYGSNGLESAVSAETRLGFGDQN